MSKINWIIAIPVIAIMILFTVTNTQSVTIKLWPFFVMETKVFLLVLLIFFLGFWVGWTAKWFLRKRK
ncbi:MAG TPA: lipopolysaccharide assembly protein LapA domain-containing protein [Alphaproteobacteria bacterium]|jgi:hypothetical protein|nr:DUF1049 domain-containing protein [Alphaproteobacteria bacterium]HMS44921.1 lipopolysaccharide assembly protein LapA domain-containing protein [Alphaproteobacteria bacterium]